MEDFNALKLSLICIGLALFFIAERLFPYAPTRTIKHDVKNVSFAVISAIVSRFWIVPITGLSLYLNWGITIHLPWYLEIPFYFILLDFWLYMWHRLMHQSKFLWRFHQVHHCDLSLDSTSALRFHFMELAFSALFRGSLLIFIHIPLEIVFIYEGLVFFFAAFHHSNIKLVKPLEKPLSKFWITPSLHWMHHHAVRQDTNSNYGVTTTLWDKLFGTYNTRKRSTDMKQGIEGTAPQDFTFIELQLLPFKRK